VVPVAGAHLVTQHSEHAAAIAAWLCVEERINPLLRKSPARHLGTKEPPLADIAAWLVPDLRADRLESPLAEFYDAFLAYREAASTLARHECSLASDEATELQLFREVLRLSRALWEYA